MKKITFLILLFIVSSSFAQTKTEKNQKVAAPITFTGFSTGNWGASGNWTPAQVPTSSDDVTIPNGKVVNLNSVDAAALSLNINAGGTLNLAGGKALTVTNTLTNNGTFTIASDGATSSSVIVGTYAGNAATYQRYFIGGQWHLFGPPVSGHLISSFVTTNGAAMTTSGVLYSLAPYNQLGTVGVDLWSNYTSDISNQAPASAFPLGQGFEINMLASGTVDFTGSILTATSAATLSASGNAWNLVANPFSSSVFGNVNADATNNFLTVNSAVLDASYVSMYIWNGSSYTIINQASGARSLAPGQAFFVKSNGGGNASFTTAMRTHQSVDNFQKAQTTGIPTVKLFITDLNSNSSNTEIKYMSGATLGLDPGFDAGRFDGVGTGFSIYTQLVQDNGEVFSLQVVPDTGYDTTVIPIGLDADVGSQITIKALATDLPVGKKVFLEDRQLNTVTEINNTDKFYTTTLSTASAGVGRFYMRTLNNSSTLATDDFIASKYTLITSPQTNNLKLFGAVAQKGSLTIYDSLGRMIYTTSLQTSTEQEINVPAMATGVYFVKIKVDSRRFNKKIVWY
ncbi:MAG: T9SS type A sorting domain-containing protein [Flavobacteriaceae bacterium]|nr:T9SS type A sorting domain-containing protein [Flavobacteriaceae bacterium]